MKWMPGKLARGTVTVGFGMGLRSVSQALVFLIVARALGAKGFGSFTAVLAVAGVLSYFSGMGASILLVRDVARSPHTFSESWGYTVKAFYLEIPIAILLYLPIARVILPNNISWTVILILGIAELIFYPLSNCAVFAYQGYEQMGKVAIMQLSPVICRLAGAMILLIINFWFASSELLITWSFLYLVCAVTSTIFVHRCVRRDLGKPVYPSLKYLLTYVKQSIPFSFSGIADKLYADGDKFMLARLASLGSAGIYSAGQRYVELTYLPLHALFSTAAPRYFRAGKLGFAGALSYSTRISVFPLLYTFVAGILIYWTAPLLPHLLGSSFDKAVNAARWLAWLPLATVPRLLLHYPLVTSGHQKAGMTSVIIGACANLTLNYFWIPIWNWRGAVAATYLAEGVMILSMLFSVVRHRNLSFVK